MAVPSRRGSSTWAVAAGATLALVLGLLTPAQSVVTGPVLPGTATVTVGSALRVALALRELADELRPLRYRLPVDAPVVRPYVEPSHAFGPGHRGIDLDAAPGSAVRAAERGRIHHAGQVAGIVWVSIQHEDGTLTSYGPLTGLQVRQGDDVARGALLGVVADGHHGDPEIDRGLHFGARRGGVPIDPVGLPGLRAAVPSLIGSGGWWGADHAVVPYDPWGGGRFAGVLTSPSPTADRAGYAVAPNANHLVLVAGLSSTSEVELVDPTHLGIDPHSTTRFSYAGPGMAYGAADTWDGVVLAAQRLEAQLREQARSEPGRPVDLLGHSLGGLVITYYLLHLHDPFDVGLPPLGHVVTVASPLEGSDLARAGVALMDAPGSGPVLRNLWDAAGALPGVLGATARSLTPDAVSLRDVATASPVLDVMSDAWREALAVQGTGPLATGTRVLHIAASLDALVGADRAALDGAERRVLPGTHDGVLATEAIREVVWQFLAGREVVASPGHLTTHVGAWYGVGLTAVSAFAGDVGAAEELPSPLLPLLPSIPSR